MIIVGYQGIGKSTMATSDWRCIDLESTCFRDRRNQFVRPNDWYVYYCQIAEDLSRQGYIVFVSSHEVVRNFLRDYCDEWTVCIYPSILLADEWKQKLKERYQASQKDKDYRAWMNAEDRYRENITGLMMCGIPHVEIGRMDYNLADLVQTAQSAQPRHET